MIGVPAAAKLGGLVDAATETFGSATNNENAWVAPGGPMTLVALKRDRVGAARADRRRAGDRGRAVGVPAITPGVNVRPFGQRPGLPWPGSPARRPLVVTANVNGEPTSRGGGRRAR